jgi:MoxR-like ATPase
MSRSTSPSEPTPDPAAASSQDSWWLFRNEQNALADLQPEERRIHKASPSGCWPSPPPWRRFDRQAEDPPGDDQLGMDAEYWRQLDTMADSNERDLRRGRTFRLPRGEDNTTLTPRAERILLAVNAAIHLRRPLLVTGLPGSGKTSLAYAIAHELGLGPVLVWAITPRSRLLEDGLYRYDALARLQQADLNRSAWQPQATAGSQESDPKSALKPPPIDPFLRLGPVGTAFLPSRWPRVLLIDEIDKGDLQLPNELLHLFEEGRYEISELTRARLEPDQPFHLIRTADACHPEASQADRQEKPLETKLRSGFVTCREFPIVVMTSNREREFAPAFHRRCIRLTMPPPDEHALTPIVEAHFADEPPGQQPKGEALQQAIRQFLGLGASDGEASEPAGSLEISDRAVDQLLNSLFLLTRENKDAPTANQRQELLRILHRNLSDSGDDPEASG